MQGLIYCTSLFLVKGGGFMQKRYKVMAAVSVMFAILTGTIILTGCGAKSFNLVDKGKSAYAIVLSSKASVSEDHAAKEFQYFIKLATKAELPIVSESGRPCKRACAHNNR